MSYEAAIEAVRVLNRIHAEDATVMPALIAYRVPCNEALTDDETVQVGRAVPNEPQCEVGLLGILNGIFGINDNRYGYIAAIYDDEGTFSRFEALPDMGPREQTQPKEQT